MAKFQMKETLDQLARIVTARVADGTGTANQLNDVDTGKFVKLVGDSQYGLCAVGNDIEGVLETANEMGTQDGFNIGSVRYNGRVTVTLDGLQGTPGTGTIAVGDVVVAGTVVAGTVVARGTALSGYPKVCKATTQTGMYFAWRVVSLDGTTAVGQTATLERVNA